MSSTAIISIIIIVLAIILLVALLMLLLKPPKVKKVKTKTQKTDTKTPPVTIENLLSVVANQNSSKDEITKALLELTRNISFPPKKSQMLNSEQKKYLNFVLLFSSHKNADAKLIAYMNKELKAKNPSYEKEIELYENEGIENRRNRR